jgi:spermidine synthase
MSWIYENRYVKSEKNGDIRVSRFFGKWEVSVNGFFESGGYMANLWQSSFKRLPEEYKPKNILILGLGAGTLNNICRTRFPDAQITVIEWDQKMIDIARDLQITNFDNTEIINDEAYSAIQKINDQFDLIFFDLYFGSKAGAWHETFFERLSTLLHPGGIFIANVFAEKEKFEYIEKYFHKIEEWKYKYNNVGIFKKTL